MCSGPRKPMSPPPSASAAADSDSSSEKTVADSSLLLELAACDDLGALKRAVESGAAISAAASWYCRSVGTSSAKMGLADRTPLMIAALYGCSDVLRFIVQLDPAPEQINRRSEFDGATALHLAAAGGSADCLAAVKILIDAGADVDALDASGRRPCDVIPKQTGKSIEGFLKPAAAAAAVASGAGAGSSRASSPETPKREYPPDLTLPDIKSGIYGTDEFRMYSFKVRPCSRAYSHDWTECPFVHPGENARRRDPRKYGYSCVPCPEFRKGSCRAGDACEYAHGVFESWLHPAQYRTRLCKDETGCNRRVCFFAHKSEELRSVNPAAASVNGVSSPRSLDLATAALLLSSASPMPMSPSAVSAGLASSPVWMNQAPTLQLPSSRLKASMSARDLDAEFELLGLEGYKQKLFDEMPARLLSSQLANQNLTQQLLLSNYGNGNNLPSSPTTLNSQLLSNYGGSSSNNLPSSPTLNSSSSSFGLDHSMAKAIMNSRATAFAKRSQSFIDRGAAATRLSASPAVSPAMGLSDWGSPSGKLDWGMQGEELNKFRKSASFAHRNNQAISPPRAAVCEEPDLSWVNSMLKDGPSTGSFGLDPWGEEQMVA